MTRPWDAARIAEARTAVTATLFAGDDSDARAYIVDEMPEALDEIERLTSIIDRAAASIGSSVGTAATILREATP